jgi:Holliday junction DNA helicase RuvA
MIASLSGILKLKNPTDVLIDVNGIGYAVSIPLSTYEKLGDVGSTIILFTYLNVREDAIQLYGFATEEERRLFKLLISVSGIGPKIAQGILSGINVEELKSHILDSNVNSLMTIPGIGRKTAERLIVELRDKIMKTFPEIESLPTPGTTSVTIRIEALHALLSLGYNQQVAEKAIRLALKESGSVPFSLEELIKHALHHTSTR